MHLVSQTPKVKPRDSLQCTFRVVFKKNDDVTPTPNEDESSTSKPVRRYRHRRISVTDFSAQLWCEKQLEWTLITGYRRETAAMRAGVERHAELEAEDHSVEDIEVTTREDSLGVRLYNTIISLQILLQQNRRVREIWICDSYARECAIRGIIDEIRLIEEDSTIKCVLCDTKTRREEKVPGLCQRRTSAMQLQTYCLMLNNIRYGLTDWDVVFEAYRVNGDSSFNHKLLRPFGNLRSLSEALVLAVQEYLPPLVDYCLVEYDFEGRTFQTDKVPFNLSVASYSLDRAMDWWLGSRESDAALHAERWKCKMCPFLSRCSASPLEPDVKAAELKRRADEELCEDLEELGATPPRRDYIS